MDLAAHGAVRKTAAQIRTARTVGLNLVMTGPSWPGGRRSSVRRPCRLAVGHVLGRGRRHMSGKAFLGDHIPHQFLIITMHYVLYL